MPDPKHLRRLAAWYRKFAERTANPAIWYLRLVTAERLEAEAARLERQEPIPAQLATVRLSHRVDPDGDPASATWTPSHKPPRC
jgi:hypothetical protein